MVESGFALSESDFRRNGGSQHREHFDERVAPAANDAKKPHQDVEQQRCPDLPGDRVCAGLFFEPQLAYPQLTIFQFRLEQDTMRKVESIARYLHRQSQVWIFIYALALSIAIGVADYLTGDELALDPFYAIPILLAVWFGNRNHAIAITVLCGFVWWWADWAAGHAYSSEWLRIWDAIVRLIFFCLVMLAGVLLKQQRQAELEAARQRNELKRANELLQS